MTTNQLNDKGKKFSFGNVFCALLEIAAIVAVIGFGIAAFASSNQPKEDWYDTMDKETTSEERSAESKLRDIEFEEEQKRAEEEKEAYQDYLKDLEECRQHPAEYCEGWAY